MSSSYLLFALSFTLSNCDCKSTTLFVVAPYGFGGSGHIMATVLLPQVGSGNYLATLRENVVVVKTIIYGTVPFIW